MGSWQWLITFVSTCLLLPSLFNQYEDTLLLSPPTGVTCNIPDHYDVVNLTLCRFTIPGNRTEEIKCTKWYVKFVWLIWIRKSVFQFSVIISIDLPTSITYIATLLSYHCQQWILFCEQPTKLMSSSIVCRLGLIFGFVIFGLLSDSFGRRKTIVINIVFEVGFRLVHVFCDSDNWFRLLVFLKSLFASGNVYMALVLICEIASNSWRSRLLAIVSSPRVLAAVCLVPLTNSGPNLETFNFIAFAFEVCLLLLLRLTPESPQWLLYNRKIPQTEELLYKAAKTNGVILCSDFKIRPVNHRAYNCLDKSWTCVELLTTYNIRFIVTALLFIWSFYFFLWSCLYIRVYTAGHHNIVLKVFSFVCLWGTIITCFRAKLTLKQLLFVSVLVTGTFNSIDIVMSCFEFNKTLRSIFSSIALASGLIGHALVLNITPRLLAINVRATLFGCCNAVGQLGTIISYLLFELRAMDDLTLMIIEIAVTFSVSAACCTLPDVDGRELPDVIEDMDYFSELSKPLRWATQKTNSPSKEEVQMRVYSFGSAAQNFSTRSHSEERLPARRIGFMKLFRNIYCTLRRFQ